MFGVAVNSIMAAFTRKLRLMKAFNNYFSPDVVCRQEITECSAFINRQLNYCALQRQQPPGVYFKPKPLWFSDSTFCRVESSGTWKPVDANPRRSIINHPPRYRKHTFHSCYLELLNMQLDRAFESLID